MQLAGCGRTLLSTAQQEPLRLIVVCLLGARLLVWIIRLDIRGTSRIGEAHWRIRQATPLLRVVSKMSKVRDGKSAGARAPEHPLLYHILAMPLETLRRGRYASDPRSSQITCTESCIARTILTRRLLAGAPVDSHRGALGLSQ